jgi:hypothetical protein
MANAKDKGNDGKQGRARQMLVVKMPKRTVAYFSWHDRYGYFRVLLRNWECVHEKKLAESGLKVTPLSCIENVFSVEDITCLACGRCFDVSNAYNYPGGAVLEKIVQECSV